MEKINSLGRRKAAVARVFLSKGSGKITVNGKDASVYFCVHHLYNKLTEALKVVPEGVQYDYVVNVNGGGVKGQADAVKLGIARALVKSDENLKSPLKKAHLLTRDSRVVERKKPGLRKARKRDQFSKR